MNLQQLQTQFLQTLQQPLADNVIDWVAPNATLSADQQLNIYRNNVSATKIKALANCFEVCHALVGEACFNVTAKDYIALVHADNVPLHEYGHRFATFLSCFEPLKTIPYLSDIAKLEWAYHMALHSPYAPLFDASTLAVISEDDYGKLRFRTASSSQILSSTHPVLLIWQYHQDGTIHHTPIQMEVGDYRYYLYKRGWEIFIEPITAGQYRFLEALGNTSTFEAACTHCLQAYPEMDIAQLLAQATSKGWISDFTV